jgi:2'-5' RNA ligase
MGNSLFPGQKALESCGDGAEPINSFALVTYIPGELGEFLDRLRRDLVPTCIPRAHVTILPPRPLLVSPEEAWEHMYPRIKDFPAFEIEARDVEMFESTSVIFVGVGAGRAELRTMHDRLNGGPSGFAEPFAYHPHITLAQDLRPEEVEEIRRKAEIRWAEYSGERSFSVDTVTFVQNTTRNQWLDLAHCQLGVPSVK